MLTLRWPRDLSVFDEEVIALVARTYVNLEDSVSRAVDDQGEPHMERLDGHTVPEDLVREQVGRCVELSLQTTEFLDSRKRRGRVPLADRKTII